MKHSIRLALASLATTALLISAPAFAQTGPAPYGAPITMEQAHKAMIAAEAEARKNNWAVVIAIVDNGGHMVALHRLDAQTAASRSPRAKPPRPPHFVGPARRWKTAWRLAAWACAS